MVCAVKFLYHSVLFSAMITNVVGYQKNSKDTVFFRTYTLSAMMFNVQLVAYYCHVKCTVTVSVQYSVM